MIEVFDSTPSPTDVSQADRKAGLACLAPGTGPVGPGAERI